MKHLVAGHDVHLGADRGGTAETLAAMGQELGYSMEVLQAVREKENVISSSAIRRLVLAGDMPLALDARPLELATLLSKRRVTPHARCRIFGIVTKQLANEAGREGFRVERRLPRGELVGMTARARIRRETRFNICPVVGRRTLRVERLLPIAGEDGVCSHRGGLRAGGVIADDAGNGDSYQDEDGDFPGSSQPRRPRIV